MEPTTITISNKPKPKPTPKAEPETGQSTETDEATKSKRKKAVNNSQMIADIKQSIENEEALAALLLQYPDVFISSVKYLPGVSRRKAEVVIKKHFPEFKITSTGRLSRQEKIIELADKVKILHEDGANKAEVIDLLLDKRKAYIKEVLMLVL